MSKNVKSVFVGPKRRIDQDWPKLASYLAQHGLKLGPVSFPRQFSGGFGNLNYLINLNGFPAVFRRPPPGPIPPGANDMLREGRILRGLENVFPLAPKCIHLCDDISVLGVPFLVMEYRPGIVIGGKLESEIIKHADIGVNLSEMLVTVLCDLHDIDPESIGLGDLGRPKGFFYRTAQGWSKRAQLAWDGEAPKAVDKILAYLERANPLDQDPVLLHNDYKLDNFILDANTLEPRALIDWDLGTRGPPLWDLAVLLSYWTELSDPPAMLELGQMPTTHVGFPDRRYVIEQYAKLSGKDVADIKIFRVLAQFRLAVVFRQLFRRYRESGEGNPAAASFNKLADGLLDFTLDIAANRID